MTQSLSDARAGLDGIIGDFATYLANSNDEVLGKIAMTNALDWGLGEFDIQMIDPRSDGGFDFRISLKISGEQSEGKTFAGDKLEMTVTGVLTGDQGKWKIEDYSLADIQGPNL